MPSECPSKFMIAVINTTRNDTRNAQAAYGHVSVDLGAPGTTIYSTYPTDKNNSANSYNYLTGTSMATPHLCGAIGALYSLACPRLFDNYLSYPDSFALLFKKYLLDGTDRVNSMNHQVSTNGRLNLYKAFLDVQSYNCDTCSFTFQSTRNQIDCKDSASGFIQITSASNLKYSWSTGDSIATLNKLTKGIYTVTMKDGTNCAVQKSFYFDNPQAIVINGVNIIPINGGNPGNIIAVVNAGYDSLSYALDAGNYQSGGTFVTNIAGNHMLHIKNEYGCVKDTTVVMTDNTGIQTIQSLQAFIYPNPAKHLLTVQLLEQPNESSTYSIYDMSGRLVLQGNVVGEKETIDVSTLENGLCVFSLTNTIHQNYRTVFSVINP